MAKQLSNTPSPFSKLLEVKKARDSQAAEQLDSGLSDTTGRPDSQVVRKQAKSADPSYTKFTTYVRKTTHRAAKLRAVEEGRELSEVVEELIGRWAAERSRV